MGQQTVSANPDMEKARRRVKSLEPQWRFCFPAAVEFDPAAAGRTQRPRPLLKPPAVPGNRTVRCGLRDVTAVERQPVVIKLFGFAMTLPIFAA